MAVCETCGSMDGMSLRGVLRCPNCWDIERRLDTYLRSEKGIAFVQERLLAAKQCFAMRAHDERIRKRDERIRELSQRPPEELRKEIQSRKTLINQMVGTLYPAILEGEIAELDEAMTLASLRSLYG